MRRLAALLFLIALPAFAQPQREIEVGAVVFGSISGPNVKLLGAAGDGGKRNLLIETDGLGFLLIEGLSGNTTFERSGLQLRGDGDIVMGDDGSSGGILRPSIISGSQVGTSSFPFAEIYGRHVGVRNVLGGPIIELGTGSTAGIGRFRDTAGNQRILLSAIAGDDMIQILNASGTPRVEIGMSAGEVSGWVQTTQAGSPLTATLFGGRLFLNDTTAAHEVILAESSTMADALGINFQCSIGTGSGAPVGACNTCDLWLRTDGLSGATVYGCEASAWAAVGGGSASGAAGAVQLSDGAGGFVDDTGLTFNTAFDTLSTGNLRITTATGSVMGPQTGNEWVWDASFGLYLNTTFGTEINLDSDNNHTTGSFAIRKNSANRGAGTLLLEVQEEADIRLAPPHAVELYIDADNSSTNATFSVFKDGLPGGGTLLLRLYEAGNLEITTGGLTLPNNGNVGEASDPATAVYGRTFVGNNASNGVIAHLGSVGGSTYGRALLYDASGNTKLSLTANSGAGMIAVNNSIGTTRVDIGLSAGETDGVVKTSEAGSNQTVTMSGRDLLFTDTGASQESLLRESLTVDGIEISGGDYHPAGNNTQNNGLATLRWATTFSNILTLGNNACDVAVVTGAPGGACTTCDMRLRTDGGTGTTLYICEGGSWAAK